MPRAYKNKQQAYSTRIPRGQSRNVSEAYDYDYPYSIQPSYEDEYEAITRSTWKRVVKKKIKKQLVFVSRPDAKPHISLRVLFSILLIFIGCVSLVYTSAMASGAQKSINAENRELKKQKDINAALTAEMTESFDLVEIEQIAINKLGMRKPRDYQIVYYDDPKQSYVVQKYRQTDEVVEEQGIISRFMDKIGIYN